MRTGVGNQLQKAEKRETESVSTLLGRSHSCLHLDFRLPEFIIKFMSIKLPNFFLFCHKGNMKFI